MLTHDLDGAAAGNDVTMTFTYNPASQIVTRTLTNDAYEFPTPLADSVRTYAVNGRNQYTQITGDTPATLGWDDNGNLTSDGTTGFGYDTENRLTSASGAKTASLRYDPLGRLYEVTTPSTVTRFVYDGDRLIAEYDGSGALLRRYVHGAGIDEPLLRYEGASVSAANRQYLHANHQGSIVALTDASGTMLRVNAYDAYGVTGAGNTGRFQYTGQAAIPELGLYYYKARFYNPSLGRFMQTDPIGYEDQMNLYAYVANDPVNSIDPNGEAAFFVTRPVVVLRVNTGRSHAFVVVTNGDTINDPVRARYSFGPQDGALRNLTDTNTNTNENDIAALEQAREGNLDGITVTSIDAADDTVVAVGDAATGNDDYDAIPGALGRPDGANSNSAAVAIAARSADIDGNDFQPPENVRLPGAEQADLVEFDEDRLPR